MREGKREPSGGRGGGVPVCTPLYASLNISTLIPQNLSTLELFVHFSNIA